MLDRDQDLKIAGNRPSGYTSVKLGADKDGMVTVWDSHHWGSAASQGGGVSVGVIPYVYRPKNNRRRHHANPHQRRSTLAPGGRRIIPRPTC